MSICRLRMRRYFKFHLYGPENGSIETWVRAAKFNLKILIRSEDINKMQTEFPRSGMHIRIQRFSDPYLPACGLNTERYGVSLRIQSKCSKTQTRKTPNADTFHSVIVLFIQVAASDRYIDFGFSGVTFLSI